MLSGRGKNLLFADADGASKFSDLDKLEECMKSLKSSADQSKISKKSKIQVRAGPTVHISWSKLVWYVIGKRVRDLGYHARSRSFTLEKAK